MKGEHSNQPSRNVPRLLLNSARHRAPVRPATAYRQRGRSSNERTSDFYAQEVWYEPTDSGTTRFIKQAAGEGFIHAVTLDEVQARIAELPPRFTERLEVVQLSRMSRKRAIFPAYGMQWGRNVFLYPIEDSLIEAYIRPPAPQQLIEARMFGGVWTEDQGRWTLTWTEKTLRDFYLNNVLIHEIGHVNDQRNTNQAARERFANWFAIEYGYRAARGRQQVK